MPDVGDVDSNSKRFCGDEDIDASVLHIRVNLIFHWCFFSVKEEHFNPK
jgi:hypothetical protein